MGLSWGLPFETSQALYRRTLSLLVERIWTLLKRGDGHSWAIFEDRYALRSEQEIAAIPGIDTFRVEDGMLHLAVTGDKASPPVVQLSSSDYSDSAITGGRWGRWALNGASS